MVNKGAQQRSFVGLVGLVSFTSPILLVGLKWLSNTVWWFSSEIFKPT